MSAPGPNIAAIFGPGPTVAATFGPEPNVASVQLISYVARIFLKFAIKVKHDNMDSVYEWIRAHQIIDNHHAVDNSRKENNTDSLTFTSHTSPLHIWLLGI